MKIESKVLSKRPINNVLDYFIIHRKTTSMPNKSIKLTSYSEIGMPPSSSGFFHLSLHPVLVTSETLRGPSGELGLAARRNEDQFS